jgi:hypothetical protein
MNRHIHFLGEVGKSIWNGTLLLRMHVDRHFLKIVICLTMGMLAIGTGIAIDNTLIKVKRNNDIIKEQQNVIAMKTFQLSEITRRSTLEQRLTEQGSKVRNPEKPAFEIK